MNSGDAIFRCPAEFTARSRFHGFTVPGSPTKNLPVNGTAIAAISADWVMSHSFTSGSTMGSPSGVTTCDYDRSGCFGP
jgi:hypothetical protein